jgi:hypothetical protein
MTTNTQPTDKTRESPKARAAFEAYCNQEERSLRKLADEIGVGFGTIQQWSRKYAWGERVKQYDLELATAAREAAKKEAARLAQRRLQRSSVMQEAGLMIIAKSRIAEMDENAARAALPTAYKLLDVGLKMERLELDLATENIKALAPPKPLSEMTDEELEEYLSRLEQIA